MWGMGKRTLKVLLFIFFSKKLFEYEELEFGGMRGVQLR